MIREWSERWGKKVSGWWFDGCYFPNSMYRGDVPNFTSFAAAARAGNPETALAFNPGVVYRLLSMTPEEDFTAGEIDKPDRITIRRGTDGRVDGTQIQMLSYLGETWGRGAPRFTTEEVVGFSKKLWDAGGAVTWDVPVGLTGNISPAFLDQLRALRTAGPDNEPRILPPRLYRNGHWGIRSSGDCSRQPREKPHLPRRFDLYEAGTAQRRRNAFRQRADGHAGLDDSLANPLTD